MVSSLRSLTTTPEQFGAAWDVSIANVAGQQGSNADIEAAIVDSPVVAAAGGIFGADAQIGDSVLWLQAVLPVPGQPRVRPVITSGREPADRDEIALGSISMRELGLSIGDSVDVVGTTFRESITVTVVGVTVVNDTYELSPGRGGAATLELITQLSPEAAVDPRSSIDPYVVALEPGADPEQFAASIESQVPVDAKPPVPHGAIRNVERIDRLPIALAFAVGLVALASLGHALMVSIRRSRSQLAVWSSLGMTPAQLRSAVAWYASGMALAATLVGVPAGVVLGRVGWQLVARQIGVPSNPVVPFVWIALVAAGTLCAANLIAAIPGWRASRVSVAEALRAE